MKKNRLLVILLLTLPFVVAAQGDLGEVMKGNVNDAKYLAEGYITPLMKSVGYGLNQGWYNTAKTHHFPGFDLTLSVNPVFVPTSDQVFTVDNAKMSSLYLKTDMNGGTVTTTGTGKVPTAFGEKKQAIYGSKTDPTVNINAPQGIGIKFFPTPTLHLGIGLPKGFDLKIRFVPTIDFGKLSDGDVDGKFNLFGVGVMHDFKQWIPGIKALPFDMSVFVGYTKMKFDIAIAEGGANGKLEFSSAATTIQALISKKISVLTPYAGFGINMATTDLAVKGSYNFSTTAVPNNITDPFKFSVASNGPRATFGLRLKFGPIAFHGDYTFAKYKSASAGFGIAVR